MMMQMRAAVSTDRVPGKMNGAKARHKTMAAMIRLKTGLPGVSPERMDFIIVTYLDPLGCSRPLGRHISTTTMSRMADPSESLGAR